MANNNGKGPQLEFEVCKMFNHEGYFTRRSIPVKTESKQDVTDIDILAINYTYPFKKNKIICDCKNKARSKPYERIFWTIGVGKFVNVSNLFIALPKLNEDIRGFAQKCNVNVISQDNLSKLKIESKGYADFDFYGEFFEKIEVEAKKYDDIEEYISILKGIYIEDNPYVGINIAISIIKKISEIGKTNVMISKQLIRYVFCEAVVSIAYSFLNICSDVFGMNSRELENYIKDHLTFGNTDSDYINKLIYNVTNYANEVVNTLVPKEYLGTKKIIEPLVISPPHYYKNIIGLIERAYNNPDWYVDIVQNLDFMLFEFLLKEKKFDKSEYTNFLKNNLVEEKIKVCKNLLIFACRSARVSLDEFWDDTEFISILL